MEIKIETYLSQLLRELSREKQKRLVTYLQRYAPPAVSLELVRERELAELVKPWKLDKVTVLFADIRNFVRFVDIVEKRTKDLEQLRKMLRDFSNTVSDIVFKYEGMRDEFAGDRFMAIFGAPTPRPDDAIRALVTAIELHETFAELSVEWQQGVSFEIPELRLGIGIHTGGPVIIGDVGSRWRHELSAMGMTTNIASRLEQLTKDEEIFKDTDMRIIVSEVTYKEIKEFVELSEPIEKPIRGMGEAGSIGVRYVSSADNLKATMDKWEGTGKERLKEERRQVEEIAGYIESEALRVWVSRIAESLRAIGETLSDPGMQEVWRQVMRQIPKTFNTDTASLLLLDENTDELVFAEVTGRALSERKLKGRRMPKDKGYVGRVVTRKEPLIVFDVAEEPPEIHYDVFDKPTNLAPLSMICAPLVTRQKRVIGAIQVISKDPWKFGNEDLGVLSLIASQAAIAIENARLRQELKKISEIIVGSQTEDQILSTIIGIIQRLLYADKASLSLIGEETDELEFKQVAGDELSEQELIGERMPKDLGWVGKVVTSKKPLILFDAPKELPEIHYDKFDKRTKTYPRSVLCAPLMTRGQVIGAIQVIGDEPNMFVQEDLEVLVLIANQAAVAVTNHRQLAQLGEQLRELERSRKMRVAAETRAKLGDIAGKLAHDLNNKLGAVRVFADDILHSETLDEAKGYVQDILDSVQSSLSEVKNLRLALKPAESQEIDLTVALHQTMDEFRERAGDKPLLEIVQNLSDESFPILGEEKDIKYVLRNLLDNALDAIDERRRHCPEWHGQISIESRRAENEPYVNVWVRDNGIGILAKHFDKLFDVEFTTKPSGKGMGYGLSWAQLYIRSIGGEIALEKSVRNEGTTFIVSFPLGPRSAGERN